MPSDYNEAKNLGFIDEIGDIDTAKEMMTTILQEKMNNHLPTTLVSYNKQAGFLELMLGTTEYKLNKNNVLVDFLPKSMVYNRRLLYLWE